MEIAVIGVNHQTAPIDIRERLSFTRKSKAKAIEYFKREGIKELIILSTCNRSEIYIATEHSLDDINLVKSFYRRFSKHDRIEEYLFVKCDRYAVEHIYNVAAGLDSLVLGEDQILGQVKCALDFSIEQKGSAKLLNELFKRAITCARFIKRELKISQNPLSISYIGIKFLKEIYPKLNGKIALIIGSGKMGQLALKYLSEENLDEIYITNRHHPKEYDVKKVFEGVNVIDYNDRYSMIESVDVIITATASPHLVIERDKIENTKEELVILDFALPRDVDECVNDIDGVRLYDIDDFKKEAKKSNLKRQSLLKKANKFIDEDIAGFLKWVNSTRVDPVLAALNEKQNTIKNDTLKIINRKLDLDDRQRKVIEKMLASAIKKMAKDPIMKLKSLESDIEQKNYIKLVSELFDL